MNTVVPEEQSIKLLYSVLPAHVILILILPGAFSKPHLQE